MTDNPNRRLTELRREFAALERELDRNIGFIASLIGAFREGRENSDLHVLYDLGEGLAKVGERFVKIGAALEGVSGETAKEELIRMLAELSDDKPLDA